MLMKMKKDRTDETTDSLKKTFFSVLKYLSLNYKKILLIIVTLFAALVFAFIKTASSNTLSSYNIDEIEVNWVPDKTIVAIKTLPATASDSTTVEKGEVIAKKQIPIDETQYRKLKKMAETASYVDYRAFANSALFHVILVVLVFFFSSRVFFPTGIEFKELITECIFYVAIFCSAVMANKSIEFSSPYTTCMWIPAVFCVFIVAILFGQLNAVFFSIIVSFSVLNACAYELEPFVFTLATTLTASRIVHKIEKRTDMVAAAIVQAVLNVVFLLIVKIIFNASIAEKWISIFGVALNGFLSGILCLGMLTPLEVILNTASPFRLMELSDLNNATMKKMLVTAGGTYNHSMMVASLAESACREIGANSLLARVGAYYHDIGKIENPEYFVENQTGIDNVHDSINPSLSVTVIRSHVKRGVEKAYALRLPGPVINIISEHHGNQVLSYFYNEAKKIDPDVNPDDYSYSGTPPSTKESAVVMLADTVEAACRTLEKKSVPALDKFITTLINGKIEHGQLNNCGLTFKDISIIHDSFVQILTGYYHSRIEYPEQKESAEKEQKIPETADSLKENEKTEAKIETKSESRSEAKSEGKSDLKSETKTELKVSSKKEPKSESKTEETRTRKTKGKTNGK